MGALWSDMWLLCAIMTTAPRTNAIPEHPLGKLNVPIITMDVADYVGSLG